MSTIHFIRHGQASFASDNYDRLSDLGRKQSDILGRYLDRLGVRFHAAYTGFLDRQIDTAELVLNRMAQGADTPVFKRPGLNEYESSAVVQKLLPVLLEDEPQLEKAAGQMMTDRRSFQAVFEKIMVRWVTGQYKAPGFAAWEDFRNGVREELSGIMKENGRSKSLAVFSSGGPLCVALQMALGLTGETAIRMNWMVKNASVTVFYYNDRSITLSSFNSVAHLDNEGDPGLITYR